MSEKYFVYSIEDQEGNIIYIGYTNNLKRRLSEHQRGSRTFRKYKKLYEYCKTHKVFIDSLTILDVFNNKKEAKLNEAFYILQEKIKHKNKLLQNVLIEAFYLTS